MGEHSVRFYEDQDGLAEQIIAFLDGGLREREPCILIATPLLREKVESWLQSNCGDEGWPYSQRGLYQAFDAESILEQISIDGVPDKERFTDIVGGLIKSVSPVGKSIRAVGEMVAILCARNHHAAALHLEELWNQLGESQNFQLFCAYPMTVFADREYGNVFRKICDAHSHVYPVETFEFTDASELQRNVAVLQQQVSVVPLEIAKRQTAEEALSLERQELSSFLENAAEGIHRVGADGTVLWANRAELELLGYSPMEYIGHNIREFHVDEATINDMLRKLLSGKTLSDQAARLRCRNGEIKQVLINSNGCFENGKFKYTRCFTRDVSDRVKLEEALHKKVAELAEADRRKDEFLAMLGHELRNPIAPLGSCLELLRIQGHDAQVRETMCDVIGRQVNLATRLINDLLDVSRIRTGKIELRREPISLQTVIDRAIEIESSALQERQHQLSVDVPPQSITIDGDMVRLTQSIANILHNAIKYTENGGHIAITAGQTDGEAKISIRDNGIGIAPELRDNIFDLFVQGASNHGRSSSGLGVGLTVVRNIIALHSGRVVVDSKGLGYGSTFTIYLPTIDTPLQQRGTPDAASLATPFQPSRILIVDDNVDAADTLGRLLAALGQEVRVVYDGWAAIDTLQRYRPELVIVDIGMPGMNGYEVAGHLREQLGNDAILVALTGYGAPEDEIKALAAGFNRHIAKPLEITQLRSLLVREAPGLAPA